MAVELKDLRDLEIGVDVRLSDYVDGNGSGGGPKYDTGLNTVAIVGFAPSSLRNAMETVFKNDQWTPANKRFIWGLNELYLVDPSIDAKADEWFDIHDPRSSISTRDQKNIDWLAAQKRPIHMIQHYSDIPASQPYPLKQIIRYWESDYLTNTISMMILLATMRGRYLEDVYENRVVDGKTIPVLVHEKGDVKDPASAFSEIHIYGVDMAQDSEYSHQRPSCEAAIGFARGLGIKVWVPPTSDLMKVPFIYGYEADGQALRKKLDARIGELKAQAENHRNIGNNAKLNLAAMVAVSNEFAAVINKAEADGVKEATPIIESMKARHVELQPEIQKANQIAEQNIMRAAMLDGAHDDASYWRRSWTGA